MHARRRVNPSQEDLVNRAAQLSRAADYFAELVLRLESHRHDLLVVLILAIEAAHTFASLELFSTLTVLHNSGSIAIIEPFARPKVGESSGKYPSFTNS